MSIKDAFDKLLSDEDNAGNFELFITTTNRDGSPYHPLPNGSISNFSFFSDRHQGGIQKLPQGGYVVSGSANSQSYLYFTDESLHVQKVVLTSSTFNHGGGLQIVDNILVVGLEIIGERTGGSEVKFYRIFDNPSDPTSLNPISIDPLTIHRSGANDTAGACGLCDFEGGSLLVVANWDAERLDFYTAGVSVQNLSAQTSSVFTPINSVPNESGAYQNINLFTDPVSSGTAWLIAMSSDTRLGNHDRADLYKVETTGSGISLTQIIPNKHFHRNISGPRFLHGSGCFYDSALEQFKVFSIEKQFSSGNPRKSRCCLWEKYDM